MFQSIISNPLNHHHCSCAFSPYRLSVVNDVLTFNASLNARVPSSLMSLSVLFLFNRFQSITPNPLSHHSLFLCLLTCHLECCQRCVGLQCITQCTCSFCTYFVPCLCLFNKVCASLFQPITSNPLKHHHCSCVCSPYSLSVINVALTFNASLNSPAPSAPMTFPVCICSTSCVIRC